MERVDENGMPYRKSFAFGYDICACCSEQIVSKMRSITLRNPIFADFSKTEVLIPAGRQHFHDECWGQLRADELAVTGN